MTKEFWVVLFSGCQDYELEKPDLSLDEVIKRATQNNRHEDYGHKGVTILRSSVAFEIGKELIPDD